MVQEKETEGYQADDSALPAVAATEQEGEEQQGNMTLLRHLEELRRRLIYSILAVGIGSCICYFFIEDIMHYLTLPAGRLYYMQPAEAFFYISKGGIVFRLSVVFARSFLSDLALFFTGIDHKRTRLFRGFSTDIGRPFFNRAGVFTFFCHALGGEIFPGFWLGGIATTAFCRQIS